MSVRRVTKLKMWSCPWCSARYPEHMTGAQTYHKIDVHTDRMRDELQDVKDALLGKDEYTPDATDALHEATAQLLSEIAESLFAPSPPQGLKGLKDVVK